MCSGRIPTPKPANDDSFRSKCSPVSGNSRRERNAAKTGVVSTPCRATCGKRSSKRSNAATTAAKASAMKTSSKSAAFCRRTNPHPLSKSTSRNRRKSQLRTLKNRFFGVFFGFWRLEKPLFGRKSLGCVEALDFTSAETTGRKSTECDRKSTERDRFASKCDRNASKRDRFASVCARHEFRLTSHRLRFFDFVLSCGLHTHQSVQLSLTLTTKKRYCL